jgi:hypothetical protein
MLIYLLGVAMAQGQSDIPSTGKSFYADFRREEATGLDDDWKLGVPPTLHYVDFKGGALGEDLDLWISTEETEVGIISSSCPSTVCKVPFRWNPSDSPSK